MPDPMPGLVLGKAERTEITSGDLGQGRFMPASLRCPESQVPLTSSGKKRWWLINEYDFISLFAYLFVGLCLFLFLLYALHKFYISTMPK